MRPFKFTNEELDVAGLRGEGVSGFIVQALKTMTEHPELLDLSLFTLECINYWGHHKSLSSRASPTLSEPSSCLSALTIASDASLSPDSHVVHSLPALIETPHMFPSLDSPHQIIHLRHQMAKIFNALSSTFTTCACGARAKDCALTQIAAFVDGEDTGERVDLGPLVGTEKGFLTNEKVPLSGGIGGIEMVTTASEVETGAAATTETTATMGVHSTRADYSNLPEFMLSPATASPSPKKNGAWKGKERIVIDTGMTDSYSSNHDDRKGNTLTSSRPRSGKLRSKRRVTIDSSPHHSPPLAFPNSARQASEDEMQWRPELAAAEPVMMPPKLRKRPIHQSFEA